MQCKISSLRRAMFALMLATVGPVFPASFRAYFYQKEFMIFKENFGGSGFSVCMTLLRGRCLRLCYRNLNEPLASRSPVTKRCLTHPSPSPLRRSFLHLFCFFIRARVCRGTLLDFCFDAEGAASVPHDECVFRCSVVLNVDCVIFLMLYEQRYDAAASIKVRRNVNSAFV